jgi:hypothetical protein
MHGETTNTNLILVIKLLVLKKFDLKLHDRRRPETLLKGIQ